MHCCWIFMPILNRVTFEYGYTEDREEPRFGALKKLHCSAILNDLLVHRGA